MSGRQALPGPVQDRLFGAGHEFGGWTDAKRAQVRDRFSFFARPLLNLSAFLFGYCILVVVLLLLLLSQELLEFVQF